MTVTCLAFSGVIAEDGLDTFGAHLRVNRQRRLSCSILTAAMVGAVPAICQVAETGGLVLSDRRDTTVRYTTSWDKGATWPNADVIILPSEFRGAYAQMAEYAPGVLGHAWSMEDDLGGATLRFTALYDSNLADPLT